MAAQELRCKACRRNLYPPAGSSGRIELHCPKCHQRQDVELPDEWGSDSE
jgi:phage FluMu protein Com